MNELPATYYLAFVIFSVLALYGALNFRAAWAFPYNAVLGTVAVWYFIEPFYFDEFFWAVDTQHLSVAFGAVLLFFISFAFFSPICVGLCTRNAGRKQLSATYIPAQSVLLTASGIWLVLLAFGTWRIGGDLFGALFPTEGRAGAQMWSRAAGLGAGAEGFIVSAASYIYVLCLATFGILLPLLPRGRYKSLALLLIVISWPYVILQGSRNITLAVIAPTILSYALFSRQNVAIKAFAIAGAALTVDFMLRVVIAYRNVGFSNIDLGSVGEEQQHLGLNMASELVHCVTFISNRMLEVSYGMGYLAELANFIPRAIWPSKPLLDVDYALARGFGGGDSDIGVFATLSTGVIGGAVLNFGVWLGPIVAGLLASLWVSLLTRFRLQATPLRLTLFLVGLGLTFNLGRGITLLVLWPMVFGYVGVRLIEARTAARRG